MRQPFDYSIKGVIFPKQSADWNKLRSFHPKLVKLANYMGFSIEWRTQRALGYKDFQWIGYGGHRMTVEFYYEDFFDGNQVKETPIMVFDEYCMWNDFDTNAFNH